MLDNRLKTCADFVTGKGIAVDVGTDHAYLAAELVASGKCSRVIASDINPGPLESAARTVEKYGVSENVELVLSDGLQNVNITIQGVKLKTIDFFAFRGCSSLESIVINGDITINGNNWYDDGAFYECTNLKSVVINGNADIGSYTFYNCSNLESVELNGQDTRSNWNRPISPQLIEPMIEMINAIVSICLPPFSRFG